MIRHENENYTIVEAVMFVNYHRRWSGTAGVVLRLQMLEMKFFFLDVNELKRRKKKEKKKEKEIGEKKFSNNTVWVHDTQINKMEARFCTNQQ